MTIDLDRLKELAAKRGQVGLKFDEAIEFIKAIPELVAEVERLREQLERERLAHIHDTLETNKRLTDLANKFKSLKGDL